MNLETIACNQCGAPLSIPDAAQFVRCNHCGASLAVRRNESVTYTENTAIAEQTAELVDQVAQLRYENEIARIDREWETERRHYFVKTKGGGERAPDSMGATLGGVIIMLIGLAWSIICAANGQTPFALFGLIFIGIGFVNLCTENEKARKYKEAHAAYRRRRMHLSPDDFRPSRGDSPEP